MAQTTTHLQHSTSTRQLRLAPALVSKPLPPRPVTPPPSPKNELSSPLNQLERQISLARSRSLQSNLSKASRSPLATHSSPAQSKTQTHPQIPTPDTTPRQKPVARSNSVPLRSRDIPFTLVAYNTLPQTSFSASSQPIISTPSTSTSTSSSTLPRSKSLRETRSTREHLSVPRKLSRSVSFSLAPAALKHRKIHMYSHHSPIREDSESVYSFDSVTTNGRLLERLDISRNDLYDTEGFDLTKRDSVVSIQTTGRLLDRLGLDDDEDVDADEDDLYNPAPYTPQRTRSNINQNPLSALGRSPTSKGLASIGNLQGRPHDLDRSDTKVNVKKIRQNIVLKNANPSADSFVADFGSVRRNDSQFSFTPSVDSIPSLRRAATVSSTRLPSTGSSINSSTVSSMNSSAASLQPSSTNILNNSEEDLKPRPHLPMAISRTPSAPIIRSRINSDTITRSDSKIASPRRSVSEGSSGSSTSLPSTNTAFTQPPSPASGDNLSPETRIKLATQLRTMGKHREASYQLQISANIPNNYPRAMYLYAMALRAGQGVKQNDRHATKWLCKCILVDFHQMTHSQYPYDSPQVSKLAEKLNQLHPEDLVKLILKQLDHTVKSDPMQHGRDPALVYDAFTKLSKAQINKVATMSKNQVDVVSMSYHELGQTLLNGWGLGNRDEINGIRLLSVAGSMGNINSMIELGEIWSSKTKHHKKDFHKAAAWLRSSEIFGFKSIGNSWIYKEKYLLRQ